MSFTVEEKHYPILSWEGRTTNEGPDVSVASWIVARWDAREGLPTTEQVMEAVREMSVRYPGRHKDYRIIGLPKPGDSLFGVEVA